MDAKCPLSQNEKNALASLASRFGQYRQPLGLHYFTLTSKRIIVHICMSGCNRYYDWGWSVRSSWVIVWLLISIVSLHSCISYFWRVMWHIDSTIRLSPLNILYCFFDGIGVWSSRLRSYLCCHVFKRFAKRKLLAGFDFGRQSESTSILGQCICE